MTKYSSFVAASVLVLTGATAFAQTSTPTPQGQTQAEPSQSEPDSARGRGFDRRAFEALTDARIAGIQAGLKLSADQQKLWTPVEQAMRDMAAQRTRRVDEFRQRREADRQQRPDLAQRLESLAQRQNESAQRLTALANAVKPFWASLDDSQKRLLPVLMRRGGGGRMMGGMMGGDRGEMRHHGGHGDMDHGQMRGPRQP